MRSVGHLRGGVNGGMTTMARLGARLRGAEVSTVRWRPNHATGWRIKPALRTWALLTTLRLIKRLLANCAPLCTPLDGGAHPHYAKKAAGKPRKLSCYPNHGISMDGGTWGDPRLGHDPAANPTRKTCCFMNLKVPVLAYDCIAKSENQKKIIETKRRHLVVTVFRKLTKIRRISFSIHKLESTLRHKISKLASRFTRMAPICVLPVKCIPQRPPSQRGLRDSVGT